MVKVAARLVLCLCAAVLAQVAGAVEQDTISARIRVLGAENVDPQTGAVRDDRVVLSWLTHTTMAVGIRGHLILLDSYITPLEVKAGRTPFTIGDVVRLKPEAIFIGHGHGDHADNAAFIAAHTGARLFASQETCEALQGDLKRMKADPFMQADPDFRIPQDRRINCTRVTGPLDAVAGPRPGQEIVRIDLLEPKVCVLAYRHLHSVSVGVDADFGLRRVVDTPDPRDAELFPPGVPLTPTNPRQKGQQNLHAENAGEGGAAAIFYHFMFRDGPNFHLANNNSVGAIKEGVGRNWTVAQGASPADGARLMDLWRALSPADVLVGTSDSGNIENNGWRDHVYLFSALRPKVYLPTHAPPATAMQYYAGMKAQLHLMQGQHGTWKGFPEDQWPRFNWLVDPADVLKPVVFRPDDPAWSAPEKTRMMQRFCQQ